ncbi:MAG: DNA-directed RNA polymerase subunit omega [Chthoniobacterales bacterium]
MALIFSVSARQRKGGVKNIPLTGRGLALKVSIPFSLPMLASMMTPPVLSSETSAILQFPAETSRVVRSLRNMTTQLLQEAALVIPNQQLLINVVSRRVRQLGLGHRPLVEATPRSSLTDIALREIIGGKLTYELTPESKPAEGV